jgi:hypothetical protein
MSFDEWIEAEWDNMDGLDVEDKMRMAWNAAQKQPIFLTRVANGEPEDSWPRCVTYDKALAERVKGEYDPAKVDEVWIDAYDPVTGHPQGKDCF